MKCVGVLLSLNVLTVQADDVGNVREVVERLDSTLPEIRDEAEKALRGRVSAWMPLLLSYLDDPRPEVRTRVARVLLQAPTARIAAELGSEDRIQVTRVIRLLAERLEPRPQRPRFAGEETLFSLCSNHASPPETARELAHAIAILPLESAWQAGCLLEIRSGVIQLGAIGQAKSNRSLRLEIRDGVLAIGSDAEIETWRKQPAHLPLLALLGSPDPRRRELGARFLGSRADDDTFAALVEVAGRSAAALEAVVWGSLARTRPASKALERALNQAVGAEHWPLSAAAAWALDRRSLAVDPALFGHAQPHTRFFALKLCKSWSPALKEILRDPEAEIRVEAFNLIARLAPSGEVAAKDLIEVYRSLPAKMWVRTQVLDPSRHPGLEPLATALLDAAEPRERALALVTCALSEKEDLLERAYAAGKQEKETIVRRRLFAALGHPDYRERRGLVRILARWAAEGTQDAFTALGNVRSKKALDALLELVVHPSEDVRLSAALWLRGWARGDTRDRVLDVLKRRKEAEQSEDVLEALEAVLAPPGDQDVTAFVSGFTCPVCDGRPPGVWIAIPDFLKTRR